jgi:hypothetical protein
MKEQRSNGYERTDIEPKRVICLLLLEALFAMGIGTSGLPLSVHFLTSGEGTTNCVVR